MHLLIKACTSSISFAILPLAPAIVRCHQSTADFVMSSSSTIVRRPLATLIFFIKLSTAMSYENGKDDMYSQNGDHL